MWWIGAHPAACFDEVAKRTFAPDQVMEQCFTKAFVPNAERYWRLWLEVAEQAMQDEAIAQVLGEAQARMDNALSSVLSAGSVAGRGCSLTPRRPPRALARFTMGWRGCCTADQSG